MQASEALGGRSVEAHPGGLGSGTQALGGREDVQGVEQVGLALTVAANDDAGTGRHIQRQAPVVAEVGELELNDAHWDLPALSHRYGWGPGRMREAGTAGYPRTRDAIALRCRSSPGEGP